MATPHEHYGSLIYTLSPWEALVPFTELPQSPAEQEAKQLLWTAETCAGQGWTDARMEMGHHLKGHCANQGWFLAWASKALRAFLPKKTGKTEVQYWEIYIYIVQNELKPF